MGGTLQPERGVSGPRASVRSARGEGRGLARCVLAVPAAGVPGGGGGIQVSAGTVDYANMESASSSCSVATWEARRSGRRRCSVRCGWSRCGTRCAGRRSARAVVVGAAAPRREAYRGRKSIRDSIPARERAGRRPSPSRTLSALPVPRGASRREKRPSSPAPRSRCAGVAPISWTPDHCAEEVSGWQKDERRTRRSTGATPPWAISAPTTSSTSPAAATDPTAQDEVPNYPRGRLLTPGTKENLPSPVLAHRNNRGENHQPSTRPG